MPSTFTRITRSTSKTNESFTLDTVTSFSSDKTSLSPPDKSIATDTTMTTFNSNTTVDVTLETTLDSASDTTMTPSASSLKAKRTRSKEPKVFQCTGYGDCQMVFTRSEHLARHTRKHTGEKPFQCCIPGCQRTFSRFDNMIQHTQTHRGKLPTGDLEPEAEAERQRVFELYGRQKPENQPEAMSVPLHPLQTQPIQPLRSCPVQAPQNPPQTSPPALLRELWLTQDEFEALQGFGLFQQKPVIIDSFQGLAQAVYIEPNPSRP